MVTPLPPQQLLRNARPHTNMHTRTHTHTHTHTPQARTDNQTGTSGHRHQRCHLRSLVRFESICTVAAILDELQRPSSDAYHPFVDGLIKEAADRESTALIWKSEQPTVIIFPAEHTRCSAGKMIMEGGSCFRVTAVQHCGEIWLVVRM